MAGKGKPKTGGRQKGTPNKVKNNLRERLQMFAEENFDEVVEAWRQIEEPEKKLKAYVDICSYALPKLQAVQLDANVRNESDIEADLKALAEES